MIYIFVFIYLLFFIINRKIYKKSINYVNVIITIWIVSSILTLINPYKMYEINNRIYMYILEFLVIFEFTSIFFYKTKYYIKINKNLDVNWNLVNFCICCCIAFMLPFSLKGINIYMNTGNFNSIRDAYLNYEICSNKMYLLTTLFIIPWGEAIGFYSILECIEKRKINFSLVMFFIFIIEIVFETGGRGRILNYAILLCIIMLENSKGILSAIKKHKKITVSLLVLIISIMAITSQRSLAGKSSFLFNAYEYLVGGIQLFSVYYNNPQVSFLDNSNLLYGQVLFSGVLYPIYTFFNLLGTDLVAGYYVVNNVTRLFLPVSNSTIINNGGTFIYYALRDFGNFGVIIYTIFISLVLTNLYKKKEKKYNLYNRAVFDFLLIKSLFLITEFNLAQTSVLMTCIYLRILCYTRKEEIIDES